MFFCYILSKQMLLVFLIYYLVKEIYFLVYSKIINFKQYILESVKKMNIRIYKNYFIIVCFVIFGKIYVFYLRLLKY